MCELLELDTATKILQRRQYDLELFKHLFQPFDKQDKKVLIPIDRDSTIYQDINGNGTCYGRIKLLKLLKNIKEQFNIVDTAILIESKIETGVDRYQKEIVKIRKIINSSQGSQAKLNIDNKGTSWFKFLKKLLSAKKHLLNEPDETLYRALGLVFTFTDVESAFLFKLSITSEILNQSMEETELSQIEKDSCGNGSTFLLY
jgi:hypothetical protein